MSNKNQNKKPIPQAPSNPKAQQIPQQENNPYNVRASALNGNFAGLLGQMMANLNMEIANSNTFWAKQMFEKDKRIFQLESEIAKLRKS